MKTGKTKFVKYTLENNVEKFQLEIRKWVEVEKADENGTWWETETPVIESIKYRQYNEEYYTFKKQLEKKYNLK